MDFKRFARRILLRFALTMAAMFGLCWLILQPGLNSATALVGLVLICLILNLFFHIKKTNREVTRFFDAVKYKDFSQRFHFEHEGTEFADLGNTFMTIVARLQQEREERETQLRHLRAIVEHVPVPLLSLSRDGKLTLWNNSARRMFVSKAVTQQEDLKHYGNDLLHQLSKIKAGEHRLATFTDDKLQRKVTLKASEVIFAGVQEKLVSIQDIQSELDGAQLQAWQDLVRVLTHEIMNSITPVTSLAKTAVDLLEDVKSQTQSSEMLEELEDVTDAVQTVARRSDGLMHFVTSYRRLTRLPPASRQNIKLHTLFEQAITLAKTQWKSDAQNDIGNIRVSTKIEPTSLSAELDTDMVEQLLLNLLQNAGHAVAQRKQGLIEIAARLNKRGHIEIDIGDNGDGVPQGIGDEVFVPFFTTKREGSGVGLALTRQIMQAHGGTVTLGKSHLGGAQFSLVF